MLQFLPTNRHLSDKDGTDFIMSQLDLDGDGKLDYNEFLQGAVNHSQLLSKANMEHMFALFDADKDGQISVSELKDVFSTRR